MCENCFDYDSPAYGGICADAGCGGRAGSIITPVHGEVILGEKVVAHGEFMEDRAPEPVESEPTEAGPPPLEDVPLPLETPAESPDEGLFLPGFDEVPTPNGLGPQPDLTPPPATSTPPGGTDPVPPLLVPDGAPRF